MLDNGLSASQVCAAAGVTFSEAQAATYMHSAASSGWSLSEFQNKTKMGARDARDLAFRFGIAFADYDPCGGCVALDWRKVKKGWELHSGDEVIGTCVRDSDGRYTAHAAGFSETLWDARAAMRNVSRVLDAMSGEMFDGQVVKSIITDKDGNSEGAIFPVEDEDTKRCRKALARKAA